MIIIEIAGHLGKDPEQRMTSTGQKVTNFNVATNIRRSGKDETVWWRVVVWGDRFEKLLQHLKKGSAVIVIGDMTSPPQIYTDKEGRQQVSVEITAEMIKFSPFGKSERPAQDQAAYQGSATHTPTTDTESSFGHSVSKGYAARPSAYGSDQGSQLDEEPLPF